MKQQDEVPPGHDMPGLTFEEAKALIKSEPPAKTAAEWWDRQKRDAFLAWLEQRSAEDENPWGVKKHDRLLREAFDAGFDYGWQFVEDR
jgi:hypothetical protein